MNGLRRYWRDVLWTLSRRVFNHIVSEYVWLMVIGGHVLRPSLFIVNSAASKSKWSVIKTRVSHRNKLGNIRFMLYTHECHLPMTRPLVFPSALWFRRWHTPVTLRPHLPLLSLYKHRRWLCLKVLFPSAAVLARDALNWTTSATSTCGRVAPWSSHTCLDSRCNPLQLNLGSNTKSVYCWLL